MTSWCGVSAEELERYWPQAFNLVARACARSNGRLTPEAVFADLKAKQMQLWLVHTDGKIEACFVTQIINYPGTRLCNILLAAGKGRQRWQHWISILEDWAREQGCNGAFLGAGGTQKYLSKGICNGRRKQACGQHHHDHNFGAVGGTKAIP
jgi:hypothetical protein